MKEWKSDGWWDESGDEVEADERSQEVDSRDEMMHVKNSDQWFLEQSGWMVKQELQQMRNKYCKMVFLQTCQIFIIYIHIK